MIYGIGTHIVSTNKTRCVAATKAIGATSLREDISWNSAESTIGTFALTVHAQAKIDALVEMGGDNILILAYGNTAHGIGQPYTQAERNKFLDYVRWIVPLTRHCVKYYEIWNEWNHGAGATAAQLTAGTHSGTQQYADLCKDCYPVIKSLAPGSLVLTGSTSKVWTGHWYPALCDAGILPVTDGFSVHPYTHSEAAPNHLPPRAMTYIDDIDTLVKAKNGGASVPLYITEMGWPTHTAGHDAFAVAGYLTQIYTLAHTKSVVSGVWWYDIFDSGTDAMNREQRFGLLANDALTPKPAYYAYLAVIKSLKTKERISVILGVVTHIVSTNRTVTAAALKGLGVNSVRQEIFWDGVEKTVGNFVWNSHYQDRIECMREAGTQNCSPLVSGNLARGIGQPYTQDERNQFLIYCRYMLPRLALAGVRFVEIWNEWNLAFGASASQLASGTWGGPAEYVALCKDVSPLIRQLVPDSVIIGGAAAGHGKAWLAQCCDAGMLNYVDAVSCHPYCYGATDPRPRTALQDLDGLQIMLRAKSGLAEYPVYITEMGWPTHTLSDGTDACRAATYLTDFYRGCELRAWIRGVWWYDIIDGGVDASNKEFRFGLLALNGATPKPAYHTYRAMRRNNIFGWVLISVPASITASHSVLRPLTPQGTRTVSGVLHQDYVGLVDLSSAYRSLPQMLIITGPIVAGVTPAQSGILPLRPNTYPTGWI